MAAEQYVTSSEAAELLGVQRQTVVNWCEQGLFAGAWRAAPGKPWHIPRASVDAMRASTRPQKRVRSGT
jgi:excisionase family DNA binding protein